MSGPAAWLRDRAKSYARDAELLRSNGDTDDAVVFEAIRDELRKCADEVAEAIPPARGRSTYGSGYPYPPDPEVPNA